MYTIWREKASQNNLAWLLMCVGVFLTFSAVFIHEKGYVFGPIVLLLASIFYVKRFDFYDIGYPVVFVIISMVAIFIFWGLIPFLIHDDGSRSLDRPIRFILAIMVFFALLNMRKIPENVLYFGLIFGAFSSGIIAIHEFYVLKLGRVAGEYRAIQFGGLAAIWFMLCVLSVIYFFRKNNKFSLLLSGLFFLAAISSGAAVYLSMSRGVWLALLSLIIMLCFYCLKKSRHIVAFFLGLLFLASAALLYAQAEDRIKLAIYEVSEYYSSEVFKPTSVGLRLEMWRNAISMIKEKPLLGWGEKGYRSEVISKVKSEDLHPSLAGFQHVHNQFLDFFVKYGILAFLSLVLFYISLTYFYIYWFVRGDDLTQLLSIFGVCVAVLFFVMNLTDSFLWNMSTATVHVFLNVVLCGIVAGYTKNYVDVID